jgi:Tfp pilus assembly protein PilF
MQAELRSRNLDLRKEEVPIKRVDRVDSKVTVLKLVADQRFVEIEATQQTDLLRRAVERFDWVSARAAIARISKLEPQQASNCNNFAWLLATGPQPVRDSSTAVKYARRAVSNESMTHEERGVYLNTLGVALLRDSKLHEAIEVLEKSLAVQNEENKPFDLYSLAACCSRTGDNEKASRYFDEAESRAEQFRSRMPQEWRTELAQFAEEAKTLLQHRPSHLE